MPSWFTRWFRPRPKIGQTQEVIPPSAEETDLSLSLKQLLQSTDIDSIVKSTDFGIFLFRLYVESIGSLMTEIFRPGPSRQIIAVNITSYFKESNLPPSVLLERLYDLLRQQKKVSPYVEHDVRSLIADFTYLGQLHQGTHHGK